MYNCIFTAHCTEDFCDKSCPILAETSYLLERNGISMNSSVFHRKQQYIDMTMRTLELADGHLRTVIATNTVDTAELLTYCAICKMWKGSRLHCNVYNLKYSKYVDEIKKSWSTKHDSDDLEYMRIWSTSAKILIISNLDYVNFGDFESQTLLTLLQTRMGERLTTIIVTPVVNSLVGKGMFFTKLQALLAEAVNGK